VAFEAGGDPIVAGSFVGPAAGRGVLLEGADVVQLGVEGGGRIGGRDEAVALLADVGIRAGAGGSVPSAIAGGEPGLDHLGMQPLDPVRDRRSWRHRNQRKGLPRSDLVHRLLVGGADGRGGQPGVAQRKLVP
jgi:hypothetical protein